MMRLLEVIVALLIVAVLGVLFGVALPDHRHIERTTEVSSPVRQIYDVISGFHPYPSWTALRAYDPKVQLTLIGPDQGDGASVNWVSGDPRIGSGSYTVADAQQDARVKWAIVNDWRGENKQYTLEIKPAATARRSRSRWATTSTTAGICRGATQACTWKASRPRRSRSI